MEVLLLDLCSSTCDSLNLPVCLSNLRTRVCRGISVLWPVRRVVDFQLFSILLLLRSEWWLPCSLCAKSENETSNLFFSLYSYNNYIIYKLLSFCPLHIFFFYSRYIGLNSQNNVKQVLGKAILFLIFIHMSLVWKTCLQSQVFCINVIYHI